MSPGNKNASLLPPPGACLYFPPSPSFSLLTAGPSRPVPVDVRAPRDPSKTPLSVLFPLRASPVAPVRARLPFLSSRSHCRKKANHISVTSSVQKRVRRACAIRKVLRYAEAQQRTGRIYSRGDKAPAVPRSRLSRTRLPLVSYCLFFHRIFFFFFFEVVLFPPRIRSRSFW